MNDLLPAQPACASEAGTWCARFYQWTNNDFLARSADTIMGTGLRIVLILVLAFLARFLLHRLVNRVVDGAANARLPRRTPAAASATAPVRRAQRARTIGSVLRSTISVIVLTIAAIMVLSEFGVNLGPILASAGIVGVAVGFGAQNLVRDFLSGMFMLLEDQYGVGDIVDLGEASGTVEAVGLRITTLRDINGTVWYVRNGEILRVGNKSQGYAVAVVDIPVAHSADIAEATALIGTVASERVTLDDVAEHVMEPVEVLGVDRVGPEGVTLRVTVKVAPGKQWLVQRALNAALTDAFDDAHVPRPGLLPALPPAGPPLTK
ncbi:mechanosensitive ion channel [Pseudonocardia petroleophila]|uniref:Mechanosensitive ion channel family protein n=1 Tax=Pseudonocardia petroleophila TaxID=37331 RepID=A0A7G7MIA2_9PSEU|nr:mechanosensitive ion channel family protein [Pseudonocardia petroleophila]QNG52513.1 mechanosensitive ion channel family protein [Pseudonocardia petroleophila]